MWLTVWKIRYNYIKTRRRRKESTNSQTWPKIESAELQLIGWRCTRPHYARYFAMRRNWAGILYLCLEIIWIWGEKKKKVSKVTMSMSIWKLHGAPFKSDNAVVPVTSQQDSHPHNSYLKSYQNKGQSVNLICMCLSAFCTQVVTLQCVTIQAVSKLAFYPSQ